MTARAPRLEWLPPLLVGASAAIAAEVALALLLYDGPGMVRSLTTILGVEGFAIAGGLWGASKAGPDLVDQLRRRWVLCLFAFLAATVFGSAWSFQPSLGEAGWGQGAGLAILAALPLYAVGSVLGGISEAARSDPGRLLRGPAAAAATGAGLGFVATGFLLPRAPLPASLLIGCLVLLSLGGMVYGSVLAARTEVVVIASHDSPHGDVRVQDRRLRIADVARRELWEGVHLRRALRLDAEGMVSWDVAAARALKPAADSMRVLIVGGGASTLPVTLLREHPTAEFDIAERNEAVVELARQHFDTGLVVPRGRGSAVAIGNLDDLVATLETDYGLVIVDTAALAPIGGLSGLSHATRWRLLDAVALGGTLIRGPLTTSSGYPEAADDWVERTYRRERSEETVVVARRKDVGWPEAFDGFTPT